MPLSYADIFQHNTSSQAQGYLFCSMLISLKVESKSFCQGDGKRIVSRENPFALKQGWKNIGWRDYVGAEQVLGALNAYEKDLLCEYHYKLFKCFESAQRTTDAELGE